jgi:hypothetical protein
MTTTTTTRILFVLLLVTSLQFNFFTSFANNQDDDGGGKNQEQQECSSNRYGPNYSVKSLGALNKQILLPYLDSTGDFELSEYELTPLFDRFTKSKFNGLKKNHIIRFIQKCANITLKQKSVGGLFDTISRNNREEEDEEEEDEEVENQVDNVSRKKSVNGTSSTPNINAMNACHFNKKFLKNFLTNTCVASVCGIHKYKEQKKLLKAIVLELYNKRYCLHEMILNEKGSEKKLLYSPTFQLLIEQLETVVKMLIWLLGFPLFVKAYFYNRNGRYALHLRKTNVNTCSSVLQYLYKVAIQTTEYAYQFKSTSVLFVSSISGLLVSYQLYYPLFNPMKQKIMYVLLETWNLIIDKKLDKIHFRHLKEDSNSWWYGLGVLNVIYMLLVISCVINFCYILSTFIWMSDKYVNNETSNGNNIIKHERARSLAIQNWTKDKRITSNDGCGNDDSGNCIEDVCFRIKQKDHTDKYNGNHDLADNAPWHESSDDDRISRSRIVPIGEVPKTPGVLRETSNGRSSYKLRPEYTPRISLNETKENTLIETKSDVTNESKNEEIGYWSPKVGDYCYAKTCPFQWQSHTFEVKRGREARRKYTMMKHFIYKFSWNTGINELLADQKNISPLGGYAGINGSELSRLSHEIAVKCFYTKNKHFKNVEIHANNKIGVDMFEAFVDAGRKYRIRGQNYDDFINNFKNENFTDDIKDEKKIEKLDFLDKLVNKEDKWSCRNVFYYVFAPLLRFIYYVLTYGQKYIVKRCVVSCCCKKTEVKDKNRDKNKVKNEVKKKVKNKDYQISFLFGSRYNSQNIKHTIKSCRDGGDDDNRNILVSYFLEDRSSEPYAECVSHIKFTTKRKNVRNVDAILDIEIWKYTNDDTSNQPMAINIQKDLTRHVALTCWKSLFKEMDKPGEIIRNENTRRSTILNALLHSGKKIYDEDLKCVKGMADVVKENLLQLENAVVVKWNRGKKRYNEKSLKKLLQPKFGEILNIFLGESQNRAIVEFKFKRDSQKAIASYDENLTITAQGIQKSDEYKDDSDIILAKKYRSSLQLYYNLGRQKRYDSISNSTSTSSSPGKVRCFLKLKNDKDDGWKFEKCLSYDSKDYNSGQPTLYSPPDSRYFYGKIIEESENGSPKYYKIRFEDGILNEKKLWIMENKIKEFKKHFCQYRAIQHNKYFDDSKERPDRHWCYGSPPTHEVNLKAPKESTFERKKKEKCNIVRKYWNMGKGEIWYSGCTQCYKCKEYFCRAHIHSHRLASDKGCQKVEKI